MYLETKTLTICLLPMKELSVFVFNLGFTGVLQVFLRNDCTIDLI